jgi:nitrite reductase (NO-forming)
VRAGVAQGCAADQFRDHLADRRHTEVAARVPGQLHEHHHGRGAGPAGWIKPWFDFWIRFQHPQATFVAYLAAVIETLIALALIAGFARKITYSAAIVFSLLIWGTAEGFGGPYTSGASDIGTAVIYALVFAALLTISYYAGPACYSADYYLEQKISWWWRVAEVRRPAPAEAPALATVNAASASDGPPAELQRSA